MISILMIILAFSITIFVHEFGHFIMARRAGVKVLTFAIGIGPRLITLHKDKQGTEWIICALPLGGFVQMKGQNDNPFDTQLDNKDNDDYRVKTPKQRLSIILAGVIMNALFAYFLLVLSYNMGVQFVSNTIGGVKENSTAQKIGLQVGDVITSINGHGVESWEDYSTYLNVDLQNNMTLDISRNGQPLSFNIPQKDIQTVADVDAPIKELGLSPMRRAVISKLVKDFNNPDIKIGQIITSLQLDGDNKTYTTAFSISRIIQTNPNKIAHISLLNENGEISKTTFTIPSETIEDTNSIQTQAKISLMPEGAGAKQGLKEGDLITSIDGQTISGWKDVYTYLLAKQNDNPLQIEVNRENSKLIFNVSPAYDKDQERYLVGITPFNGLEGKLISYIPETLQKIDQAPKVGDYLVDVTMKDNIILYTLKRGSETLNIPLKKELLPSLNIGHAFDFVMETKTVKYGVVDSVRHSFKRSYYELISGIHFIKAMVSGDLSPKLIGGPIRIFQVSHFVAENKPLSYFLLLFAKIGFSLAIVNLLPIPVLDGGHALLILIEMIRRKPLSEELAMKIHQFGVFIMLTLMIFVFYNDITSLLH